MATLIVPYNRPRQGAYAGERRERKLSQASPMRTHLRQLELPLARVPNP